MSEVEIRSRTFRRDGSTGPELLPPKRLEVGDAVTFSDPTGDKVELLYEDEGVLLLTMFVDPPS